MINVLCKIWWDMNDGIWSPVPLNLHFRISLSIQYLGAVQSYLAVIVQTLAKWHCKGFHQCLFGTLSFWHFVLSNSWHCLVLEGPEPEQGSAWSSSFFLFASSICLWTCPSEYFHLQFLCHFAKFSYLVSEVTVAGSLHSDSWSIFRSLSSARIARKEL